MRSEDLIVNAVILVGNLVILGGAVVVGLLGGGVLWLAVAPMILFEAFSIGRQVSRIARGDPAEHDGHR